MWRLRERQYDPEFTVETGPLECMALPEYVPKSYWNSKTLPALPYGASGPRLLRSRILHAEARILKLRSWWSLLLSWYLRVVILDGAFVTRKVVRPVSFVKSCVYSAFSEKLHVSSLQLSARSFNKTGGRPATRTDASTAAGDTEMRGTKAVFFAGST